MNLSPIKPPLNNERDILRFCADVARRLAELEIVQADEPLQVNQLANGVSITIKNQLGSEGCE